jgi:hypothetical protein
MYEWIRRQDPQLAACGLGMTLDRQLTTITAIDGRREQIDPRLKARPVKQWESAFERCQSS